MPAAALTPEVPGDRSANPPSLGWFGKIPAAGDFIHRRLPNDFLQPWDEWLQSGIARGRSVLEARWDEVYLTFPVWRFLLPAGTGSHSHWAGILMPSVDRVGRHFPLTVAAPIHQTLETLSLAELESQLFPVEQAGLAALDGEPIGAFDDRLRQMPAPDGDSQRQPAPWLTAIQDPLGEGHWPLPHRLDRTIADAAGRSLLSCLGARTLWWLPGNEHSGGTIRLHPWPLTAEVFIELIQQD